MSFFLGVLVVKTVLFVLLLYPRFQHTAISFPFRIVMKTKVMKFGGAFPKQLHATTGIGISQNDQRSTVRFLLSRRCQCFQIVPVHLEDSGPETFQTGRKWLKIHDINGFPVTLLPVHIDINSHIIKLVKRHGL